MSNIKADTLSTLDGTKSITTDRVTQGVARAWVNFNGTGTVAIRASFNVSSITDNGVGEYTVNFTTAMPDADYAAVVGVKRPAGNTEFPGIFTEVFTTGSVQISNVQPGVSFFDSSIISVAIFR